MRLGMYEAYVRRAECEMPAGSKHASCEEQIAPTQSLSFTTKNDISASCLLLRLFDFSDASKYPFHYRNPTSGILLQVI